MKKMLKSLSVITLLLLVSCSSSRLISTNKPMDYKGLGTEESPFLISTPEEFLAMNNLSDSYYFRQTTDLDFSNVEVKPNCGTIINEDSDNYASKFEYTEVCSLVPYFLGNYDGDGHDLSGISINGTFSSYDFYKIVVVEGLNDDIKEKLQDGKLGAGVFGVVAGHDTRIENLNIVDADIKVDTQALAEMGRRTFKQIDVGILAGSVVDIEKDKYTIVNNVTVSGNLQDTGKNSSIGGLIGQTYSNTWIYDSYADVNIKVLSSGNVQVGGLVGNGLGSILRSSTKVNLETQGVAIVGGFVGVNYGHIEQSFSDVNADIIGEIYFGGFAGLLASGARSIGNIQDSFVVGYGEIEVEGESLIGGFIGKIYEGNFISNTYNLMSLDVSNVGSNDSYHIIVGKTYDEVSVRSSYYPISVQLRYEPTSYGDKDLYVTGLYPSELRTGEPLENFDETVWDFTDGQYPLLINNLNPLPEGFLTNEIELSTPNDFKNMKHKLWANYIMVNDIDFDNIKYIPVGGSLLPFLGTLNGDSYIISNLNTINVEQITSMYYGLFGTMYGAEVFNLKIHNAIINQERDSYAVTGVLVGSVHNSLIHDIEISGVVTSNSPNGSIKSGILAGKLGSDNEIYNIAITGRVVFATTLSENRDPSYIGGVIGHIYGDNNSVHDIVLIVSFLDYSDCENDLIYGVIGFDEGTDSSYNNICGTWEEEYEAIANNKYTDVNYKTFNNLLSELDTTVFYYANEMLKLVN